MTAAPRALLNTRAPHLVNTADTEASEGRPVDFVTDLPHARSLQAFARDEMELAVDSTNSNVSSDDYRQPTFVNTTLQGVLEPDTFYALFVVTEDKIRPQPNLLPTAKQWIFRTQTATPPACSIACPSEGALLDSVQLDVQLNSTGTVYYVVQRSGVDAVPTAAQVRRATPRATLRLLYFVLFASPWSLRSALAASELSQTESRLSLE
jgi:hypothetical protein